MTCPSQVSAVVLLISSKTGFWCFCPLGWEWPCWLFRGVVFLTSYDPQLTIAGVLPHWPLVLVVQLLTIGWHCHDLQAWDWLSLCSIPKLEICPPPLPHGWSPHILSEVHVPRLPLEPGSHGLFVSYLPLVTFSRPTEHWRISTTPMLTLRRTKDDLGPFFFTCFATLIFPACARVVLCWMWWFSRRNLKVLHLCLGKHKTSFIF